jgi:hypothetical protein
MSQDNNLFLRTQEDIIYYFVEKKRLITRLYNFVHSKKTDDCIYKAAKLCEELEITPAEYVQLLYDNLGSMKKYFSPHHLCGTAVEHFFMNRGKEDTHVIEMTKDNICYYELWDHLLDLCRRQMVIGRTMEEVLMDSSIKLFAWFRILASPVEIPEVTKKYKRIARLELNEKIIKFIKEAELDIDRVLN